MERYSIVENYLLTENFINSSLEANEEIEVINESTIIDNFINKIKSLPKTTKIIIKKRTPEEQKKFKQTKQYKKAEAKLKKKAIKTIAKEYDISEKEAADKHTDHKLFYLINLFLIALSNIEITYLTIFVHPLFWFGLIVNWAYVTIITTKTFKKFLDTFNKLIKTKTPTVWDFITDIEATIYTKLNKKDDNTISGKDESYTFVLDC